MELSKKILKNSVQLKYTISFKEIEQLKENKILHILPKIIVLDIIQQAIDFKGVKK